MRVQRGSGKQNYEDRRSASIKGRSAEKQSGRFSTKKEKQSEKGYIGKGAVNKRKGGNAGRNTERPKNGSNAERSESWKAPAAPLPSELRVSVETIPQLKAALAAPRVQLIYIDESIGEDTQLPALLERIHAAGKLAGLRLRRIQRLTDDGKNSLQNVTDNLEKLDAVLVRTLDQAVQLQSLPEENRPELVYDYTVYGYNHAAAEFLQTLGAERLTDPIELNSRELLQLRREIEAAGNGYNAPKRELLVYGHLPMMVSANCVHRTTEGCDHKNSITRLKDRMQKSMPVRAYCKYCYNQIFNADPCVLYDLSEECLRLRPDSQRFDFSVESGETAAKILSLAVPGSLTRGHFHHGVD